jgi:hypothetical protein
MSYVREILLNKIWYSKEDERDAYIGHMNIANIPVFETGKDSEGFYVVVEYKEDKDDEN